MRAGFAPPAAAATPTAAPTAADTALATAPAASTSPHRPHRMLVRFVVLDKDVMSIVQPMGTSCSCTTDFPLTYTSVVFRPEGLQNSLKVDDLHRRTDGLSTSAYFMYVGITLMAGQSMHIVAPVVPFQVSFIPPVTLTHSSARLVNVCTKHLLQAVELLKLLKVFGAHLAQCGVTGGLLYVPGLKPMQLVFAAPLDFPGRHHVHVDAPDTLVMLPGAHGRHGAKPPGPAKPATHEH